MRLCAEPLIQLRVQDKRKVLAAVGQARRYAEALQNAAELAHAAGAHVDAVRWGERSSLPGTPGRHRQTQWIKPAWKAGAGWLANVQTASTAIWSGCGVGYRDGELWVEPTWPSGGTWWALLGLPDR